MAGRHLALVIVSPDALWRLFLKPGEHRAFRIGNVPPDARLVRVYHQPALNGVCFELEHEAFPECLPLTSPIVLDATIEFLGVDSMFLETAASAEWLDPNPNNVPTLPRSRRRVTLEEEPSAGQNGIEVDGVMVPHAAGGILPPRDWRFVRLPRDVTEMHGPIGALLDQPPGPGTLIEQAEQELIRQGMPPTAAAMEDPERYECGESCGGYFTLNEWGEPVRDGLRRCPGCGRLTHCSYDDPTF